MGEIADEMIDRMWEHEYRGDYDYDDPDDYIGPRRHPCAPPAKADEFEVNE